MIWKNFALQENYMNNLQKFLIFTIAFIMAIITLVVSIRNTCRMLRNTVCSVAKIERQVEVLSKEQEKKNVKINSVDVLMDSNEYISGFMEFLLSNGAKVKTYKANRYDKNWIFEGKFVIENSHVENFFRSFGKNNFFNRIGKLSIATDNNSIVIDLKMHKDEKKFKVVPSISNYCSIFNFKHKNNGKIFSDSKIETISPENKMKIVYGTCLGKISENGSELFYIKLNDESVITLSSEKMSGTENEFLFFSSENTIYKVIK